jgi:hypothetical protein
VTKKRRGWPKGRNGDLPDWYGPDEKFVAWTLEKLSEKLEQRAFEEDPSEERINPSAWPKANKLELALFYAQNGNIKPLRALFPPAIARYIHLPKRWRTPFIERVENFKRYIARMDQRQAGDVAALARDIYAIWEEYYRMKKRSRFKGQSTAADVALAFYDTRLKGEKGLTIAIGEVEDALWEGRKTPKKRLQKSR